MAKNYTKKQVMDAVKASEGVTDVVASRLGCTWNTARDYINKWPETKREHEKQDSVLVEKAVSALAMALRHGERWAIERVLDTRARRAGFGLVSHAQIDTTSNGETINRMVVEYVDPKPQPPPDAPPPKQKKGKKKNRK